MMAYILSVCACMMCVGCYINLTALEEPDATDKVIVWSILIFGFIPIINTFTALYCISLCTIVVVLIKLGIIDG